MKSVEKNTLIVKEVSKDAVLRAILYKNGIIEIIWNTSIDTIEILHLRSMKEVIYELGGGKKMPLFFTVHDFLQISSEARKFAASEECITYTLANAVLVDNLPKKLLFNFFMNFNKPIAPTKGFSNRADAFAWLEKLENEAGK